MIPTLSSIFGQDQAIDWLRRAIASERLPHGLLFAGPVGVGKGTTASALAAWFLCDKPKGDAACGKCPSCVVFAAGNHPDFRPIYRQLIRLKFKDRVARDISVDVIRDYLIDSANLKPAMDRGKVFVIEEAELMSTAAQNTLLKTLEEPHGRTLIILLTDQPGSLLPTIRSRCQIVRFNPLDESIVRRELEKHDISKTDAARAARIADGSLGLAIKWLNEGVIENAVQLGHRLQTIVGGDSDLDLPDFLKKCGEGYAEKQLEIDELASKDQANRDGLSLYLRLAAQFFRVRIADEKSPDRLEQYCQAIEAMARGQEYLDSNVTVSLILQEVAVRLDQLFVRIAVS